MNQTSNNRLIFIRKKEERSKNENPVSISMMSEVPKATTLINTKWRLRVSGQDDCEASIHPHCEYRTGAERVYLYGYTILNIGKYVDEVQ